MLSVMQVLPTFHTSIDIIHETMNRTQGLCTSHANVFLGQFIQSLESVHYLSLLRQFLYELLCSTLSHDNIYITVHLLSRPSLYFLVAKASTESNSAIIFTKRSVISKEGGIVVYISRRLRKLPKRSKSSIRSLYLDVQLAVWQSIRHRGT